jgi:hypothetical protein
MKSAVLTVSFCYMPGRMISKLKCRKRASKQI